MASYIAEFTITRTLFAPPGELYISSYCIAAYEGNMPNNTIINPNIIPFIILFFRIVIPSFPRKSPTCRANGGAAITLIQFSYCNCKKLLILLRFILNFLYCLFGYFHRLFPLKDNHFLRRIVLLKII